MLLQVHQTELELAVGKPQEEEMKDDELAGVRALFDMVGASKPLGVPEVTNFLEKLGVYLPAGRVAELHDTFSAEPDAPGGPRAVDVAGFRRMLTMIISSGDIADLAGGAGDHAAPLHKFPAKEVKELQKIFDSVDVDGDKELDYGELQTVFVRWGLEGITGQEVAGLIGRFDVNNSGTLDFDEFLGLASSAKSLAEGDEQSMEMTIKTHFAREHAKVKSLSVRQKLAVDAATLKFFKDEVRQGSSVQNSIDRAARVAKRAMRSLGGDPEAEKKAYAHVQQRLTGELDGRLLEAAEAGKADDVAELITRGANKDARRNEPPRENALLLALQARHVKAAMALLDAGVDAAARDDGGVNDPEEHGITPLLAVTQRGKVGEVDQLLNFGADANQADAEGSTALMRAAQSGHKAIVQRLLSAGCDVNKIDEYNRSARDRAMAADKVDIAGILKDHGGLFGAQILEASGEESRPALPQRRGSARSRIRSLGDVEEARKQQGKLAPLAQDPAHLAVADSSAPSRPRRRRSSARGATPSPRWPPREGEGPVPLAAPVAAAQ
ncbi:hypothetical protein JL720_6802 [Aureococcus anophagefferens]|nr:hypothetical protein JL720_6802 [Aureococcus anophagefferens]